MIWRLSIVAVILAAACCCSAPDDSSASGADCASHMWPRVIVGVSGGDENSVTVRMRLADGTILDGHRHGCPRLPHYVCSYSFFTAPRDREVVLSAESGGRVAERRITLGPFTYEPRDITYIVITLKAGATPSIGEPRLIHPC